MHLSAVLCIHCLSCYYMALISLLDFSVTPSLKFQLLYILILTWTATISEAKNVYLCSSVNMGVKQLQEFCQHMYSIALIHIKHYTNTVTICHAMSQRCDAPS